MFHRMVTSDGNPKADNVGVFQHAIKIWKTYENEGTTPEQKKLHKLMTDFNHHLKAPHKVPNYGIFWFVDGSKCIPWALELCAVLNKLKVKTAYYTAPDPGKILYTDEHQVIASYHRRVKATRQD